jgi:hypothetical protein
MSCVNSQRQLESEGEEQYYSLSVLRPRIPIHCADQILLVRVRQTTVRLDAYPFKVGNVVKKELVMVTSWKAGTK